MTPDEFDAGMAVLLATWPKEASSEHTLAVYEQCLGHLEPDVWQGALLRCLTECTFFPRPAEVLEKAVEFVMERDGLSQHWARQAVFGERREERLLLYPAQPQAEPESRPALPPPSADRQQQARALMAGIGKGARG